MTATAALRLHPDDTVVVALRDITAGERINWQGGGDTAAITVQDPVPLGHKISLSTMPPGMRVMKYGAPIGTATQPISTGQHVHVHNIASSRAGSRS